MSSKYFFKNFQKTFVFLKVFWKKCFYRNDAGSLKLTVLFTVKGIKANC